MLICPFCFIQFTPQDLRFRCVNPVCQGHAPDYVYAKERGYAVTMMGRVLVPGKRMFGQPEGVVCDACKVMSYTRICPNCHFELSNDIGQVDQRIIAIIGGRATGKTHYIASLVTRLQNEVAQNFDIHVRMMGEDTQMRWERDFYTPLFVRKMVLKPNLPAANDAQVKSPLMFRFMFNDGSRLRAINISFFDSAGEDMKSVSTMSVQNRYICHADGIIFLLDPLQIPTVRQQLPSVKIPPPDMRASPEYIVGNLRELFEQQHRLRPTQKIKVPIAFTLSKVDTLIPILEPGSALQRPSSHPGWVDLDDVQSVDTEISHYLTEWINPAFLIGIRNDFASYNYFGVSSLGEQPDTNDHLSTVSPLRVEDPFLWLLYKLGLVKGKKGW
jgi:hypothetical protein